MNFGKTIYGTPNSVHQKNIETTPYYFYDDEQIQ